MAALEFSIEAIRVRRMMRMMKIRELQRELKQLEEESAKVDYTILFAMFKTAVIVAIVCRSIFFK